MSEKQVLREYRGNGTIRSAQGIEVYCSFVLNQYSTGKILLKCSSNDPRSSALIEENRQKPPLQGSFEGVLAGSSAKLTIETMHLNQASVSFGYQENPFIFEFFPFKAVEIDYVQIPFERSIKFRVGLTNLCFLGTEWSKRGSVNLLNILPIDLPSGRISLELLKPYNEVTQNLQESRGILVTAELVIDAKIGERDKIREICDNLCILFSFATGTWISWMYEDYFLDEQLVKTSLIWSKTLPYNRAGTAIDTTSGNELKDYIQTTYPIYVQRKDRFGLNIVIEYYIHSKSMRIRELKYLIAAIGMECLSSYLSDYFKAKGKVVGLGSFRKRMESLYQEVSMPYEPEELDFIAIRDKIVHTGRFPAGVDAIDAYRKLINLYDRTMLTILGYRGRPYINISNRYAKELIP